MPVQIANPVVVAKIERLAAATGLTKAAAVEKAVDAMLQGNPDVSGDEFEARVRTILAQIDRIPDWPDAFEPLEWDDTRCAAMIAVDTSALVAIVLQEPERGEYLAAIRGSVKAFVSTVSVVETKMVVFGRRGLRAIVMLDDLFALRKFELTPPSVADKDAAYAAFLAYGKGSGHQAALNFGDAFSYALAKIRDVPLLYKGNDFSETDLRSALSNLPPQAPRH